jgi:uncharacterized protein YjiS (DUF1127 family)
MGKARKGSLDMKNPLRAFAHRYRRWQVYQRTLSELEMMSDRDLRDLGFSRHDLQRIARESAGY